MQCFFESGAYNWISEDICFNANYICFDDFYQFKDNSGQ